jgi:hypothetical protein
VRFGGGNDDVGELLVVGGGEEVEQLALHRFVRGGQFAGGVDGKGVPLGLVPGLELAVEELVAAADPQLLVVPLLEEAEEGGLFGGEVESFRVGLLPQRLRELLREVDALLGGAAGGDLLLREEIQGQFVLVYLDQVDLRPRLAQPVVLETQHGPLPQGFRLRDLLPR